MLGTCFYAFGIGLIFPTLFRFTLFSNDLPKGTVSASLNIVILSVSALSIEAARWLWFNGGRLPFHLLGVAAGIAAACCLAGLLSRIRQQPGSPSWRRSSHIGYSTVQASLKLSSANSSVRPLICFRRSTSSASIPSSSPMRRSSQPWRCKSRTMSDIAAI